MKNNEIKADVAIIGGGASGMLSAISVKMTNRNLKVVVLEKLSRIGKKILATGNGRCNLGNKNISEKYFHGSISNLMDIIQDMPDTESFFNSLGVICNVDSDGRIYPYSNHSSSVLNSLRIKMSELGVEEICDFDVTSIDVLKNGFAIKSDRTVYAKSVIVATGGYSAPVMGTDGKFTDIMKKMGHKVTAVSPSLSALEYKNPKEYKSLSGIRAIGKVTAYSGKNKLDVEKGEIQFTDSSISGICIFNLSHLALHNNFYLDVDFMPEKTYQEVADFLFYLKKIYKNCTLEDYLTGIFRKNLGMYIIKKATNKPMSCKVSEITSQDIKKTASVIKSDLIEVNPPNSWKNSQVTFGGISGESVDNDLQSKLYKGMYFCGEILDVDGKCGGYNLTWAWASGMWAGRKCAERLGVNNDKSK